VHDFLEKPLKVDHFAKTIERLKELMKTSQQSELLNHTLGADIILINIGNGQLKQHLQEIIYLDVLKDYAGMIASNRKHVVLSPLVTLIKENYSAVLHAFKGAMPNKKYFIKK